MIIQEIITIFERDLQKLKAEIEAFQSDDNLWKTTGTITNSAGNLALHLTGNLNHYIGHLLGHSGYIRNRPAEFESKHVPKEKLLKDIDGVTEVITQTLRNLNKDDLTANYPEKLFEKPMTTSFMLIHLVTHLNYHRGQINYIRRVLE